MDRGEWEKGEWKQPKISKLLAVLPDPVLFKTTNDQGDSTYHSGLTLAVNVALPELRKLTSNCPACIMSALRQKGIPVPMATDFDFSSEMKSIWAEINFTNDINENPW